MSTTDLELQFDGDAVASGKIDAGLLGNSLAAYSQLFRRANELANGRASEAVVLVESNFQRGSFDVSLQLIQNILQDAKDLITAHPFLSAADLAAIIGLIWSNRESLIKVLKWLRGEKPQKINVAGNNVELVLFGQKKVISNTVNVFLGDSLLREALGGVVQPLRQPGIDRIRMRPKSEEPDQRAVTIEKDEIPYFEPDSSQLSLAEAPDEGERDTTLIVAKLSFVEGPRWTFYERGATVVAKVVDTEFWQNVHQGKIKFGEGDRVRVRLHWKMVERRGKPLPENTVVKVYEVLPRARQMRLDEPQGRKFRDL